LSVTLLDRVVQLGEEGGADWGHLQGFGSKGLGAPFVGEAETDELSP